MTPARGMALLEVIVALTIFSVAALGAVEQLAQLAEAQRQSALREERLTDADRLLTAVSLLTRRDLDLRLGRREVGPWIVEVQRPRPDLYRIEVGSGAQPDLTTLLYRPEPTRAR